MYAAPVVYPASLIPQKYRLLYGLNPMAGVIEGFRAALLGSRPMPWDLITGVLWLLCLPLLEHSISAEWNVSLQTLFRRLKDV